MRDACEQLCEDPLQFLDPDFDYSFDFGQERLERIYLSGIRRLLARLRPRVRVLDKLCREHGIERIDRVDDVVPLLFPHTVFKSYPLTWLDNGDFGRLTKWLAGLSAIDLSEVGTDDFDSIDAWVDRLDQRTDMRLCHTFGTTGKLSFIPRSRDEWERGARLVARHIKYSGATNTGPDLFSARLPMVQPTYRYGASTAVRVVDTFLRMFAGGEDNALFLYPDARFSADVACLASRLRGAELRGELDSLEISPTLRKRRAEFAAREKDRPAALRRFFDLVQQRYAGKDVYLFAVWPVVYEWAEQGLERGIRDVFGPGSVLHTGGGKKDRVLPDDWQERVFEFLGFRNCHEFYAMSELVPSCPRCPEGNYHLPPTLVPFVLDPQTGNPLPREEQTRGRFAALDLLTDSYWAGIVSGDEVTLSGWDERCRCGRGGPFVGPSIRRYSEKEDGTDKINCAGAPEAHERAIQYLLDHTE